jgi:hypothetical protein
VTGCRATRIAVEPIGRTGVVLVVFAVAPMLVAAPHMYAVLNDLNAYSLRLTLIACAAFVAGGALSVGAQFAHMMGWPLRISVISTVLAGAAFAAPIGLYWLTK